VTGQSEGGREGHSTLKGCEGWVEEERRRDRGTRTLVPFKKRGRIEGGNMVVGGGGEGGLKYFFTTQKVEKMCKGNLESKYQTVQESGEKL
jgi:hypothetical protein